MTLTQPFGQVSNSGVRSDRSSSDRVVAGVAGFPRRILGFWIMIQVVLTFPFHRDCKTTSAVNGKAGADTMDHVTSFALWNQSFEHVFDRRHFLD